MAACRPRASESIVSSTITQWPKSPGALAVRYRKIASPEPAFPGFASEGLSDTAKVTLRPGCRHCQPVARPASLIQNEGRKDCRGPRRRSTLGPVVVMPLPGA
jgi:hypothetical protein